MQRILQISIQMDPNFSAELLNFYPNYFPIDNSSPLSCLPPVSCVNAFNTVISPDPFLANFALPNAFGTADPWLNIMNATSSDPIYSHSDPSSPSCNSPPPEVKVENDAAQSACSKGAFRPILPKINSEVTAEPYSKSKPAFRVGKRKSSKSSELSPEERKKIEAERRRRNTEASARFRQRKKERASQLQNTAKNMAMRVEELETQVDSWKSYSQQLEELLRKVAPSLELPLPPSDDDLAKSSSDCEDDDHLDSSSC